MGSSQGTGGEKPRPAAGTRRASEAGRQAPRRGQKRSNMVYALLPAIVVVVVGIVAVAYWSGGKGNDASGNDAKPGANEQAALLSDVTWPTYVTRGPESVKEAYQFAVLRPDVLEYLPCFCGCGQHNGHKSNKDCFIGNMNQGGRTIAFERHGAT